MERAPQQLIELVLVAQIEPSTSMQSFYCHNSRLPTIIITIVIDFITHEYRRNLKVLFQVIKCMSTSTRSATLQYRQSMVPSFIGKNWIFLLFYFYTKVICVESYCSALKLCSVPRKNWNKCFSLSLFIFLWVYGLTL